MSLPSSDTHAQPSGVTARSCGRPRSAIPPAARRPCRPGRAWPRRCWRPPGFRWRPSRRAGSRRAELRCVGRAGRPARSGPHRAGSRLLRRLEGRPGCGRSGTVTVARRAVDGGLEDGRPRRWAHRPAPPTRWACSRARSGSASSPPGLPAQRRRPRVPHGPDRGSCVAWAVWVLQLARQGAAWRALIGGWQLHQQVAHGGNHGSPDRAAVPWT